MFWHDLKRIADTLERIASLQGVASLAVPGGLPPRVPGPPLEVPSGDLEGVLGPAQTLHPEVMDAIRARAEPGSSRYRMLIAWAERQPPGVMAHTVARILYGDHDEPAEVEA